MAFINDPEYGWVFGIALALCLVFIPKLKKLTQYVGTIFHEVGHVLSSLVTGGGASSIRIRFDTSGDAGTMHKRGLGGRFSRIVTLLSGYAAPANLGFILILLSFTKWEAAGFWIIAAFSVIALVLIRNAFGFLVTISFVGVLTALYFIPYLLTTQQTDLMFGGAMFLIGLKDIYKIIPHAWRKSVTEEQKSDFHILAGETGISSRFWLVVFLLMELVIFGLIVTGFVLAPIT